MRLSTSSDITTKSAKSKAAGSNDIFDKCRNFTRPGDLQAAGLYMYFEVFGDREGCGAGEIRMGKRKVLMFGSNDYLDLINHPKVKEAVALGIPDDHWGEAVKVYIVLRDGESATAQELIDYCHARMARYKVPKFVEFRRELPKSLVGKILRRRLLDEEVARQATTSRAS